MNQRIREFAEQAGIYQPERFDAINGSNQLEKFAQLIVEEACRVLEAGKPGVVQVPAEIVLDMMQKNLKAYFGDMEFFNA